MQGIYDTRPKNQSLFAVIRAGYMRQVRRGRLDIGDTRHIFPAANNRTDMQPDHEMESSMNITGVILAAGTSSRMGSGNKLLLPYRNHTVIEEVLKQLSDSAVDDIIVVTGYERARIEALLADYATDRIKLVYNHRYRLGRAESIKIAIKHLMGKADAALFMVADKPGVTCNLINRAIDLFREKLPAMVYVETPYGRGHPVIFSKSVFGDLASLQGDCVGNELVARHAHDTVTLKDESMQIDVDTEDDYRILLKTTSENGRDEHF